MLITLLTHSFPMHPFSNSWKQHRKNFWCFRRVEKRCIGNKWVTQVSEKIPIWRSKDQILMEKLQQTKSENLFIPTFDVNETSQTMVTGDFYWHSVALYLNWSFEKGYKLMKNVEWLWKILKEVWDFLVRRSLGQIF